MGYIDLEFWAKKVKQEQEIKDLINIAKAGEVIVSETKDKESDNE